MPHVLEPATSGRAQCRGCGRKIAKGELRFGERQPNAFGEGEMTLWFHPVCAAYTRPEPFLELLADAAALEALEEPSSIEALRASAEHGARHRRLPRLHGAERSPTGRARCRCCRELIEKGAWRLPLVFFEEFRFQPSGFIHAGCAGEYFDTVEIMDRVRHFSPTLTEAELAEIESALAG